MKIRVLHSYYGCDTGCCGHIVEVDGKDIGSFSFDHPRSTEDLKTWARALVEEKLGQYAPKCLESIDWETLDVSGVRDSKYC